MTQTKLVLSGVLLLAIATISVLFPMSAMYADYRVAEAVVAESHYHTVWLATVLSGADSGEQRVETSRQLRSRLESEQLKLAYAAGVLKQLNPEWQIDEPAAPFSQAVIMLLPTLPKYWTSYWLLRLNSLTSNA